MTENDLTIRIAMAYRELRRVRSRPLSKPIPPGQLDTMDAIARMGSCSMVELASELQIDASSATRAVDRLVETGLATRQRSDGDARTVLVALTGDGNSLTRQLTRERIAHMDETLSQLTQSEQQQLAASLDKLLGAIRWRQNQDPSARVDR